MLKVTEIYFSPSNTTKKVAKEIASNFNSSKTSYDLLIAPKATENIEFNEEDLVIVAMPIFAGRIPKIAREKLECYKGNNTPAIAVVNFGNRAYDYGLYELKELLEENGFKVIGAGAFISQHSLFKGVAKGRPDEKDLSIIKEFSKRCIEKLESKDFSVFEVPGKDKFLDYKDLPIVPECDESLCTFCYDCVSICPLDAIPDEDPVDVDKDLCNACTACISICPEDARSFKGEVFEAMNSKFIANNSERKEGEFFI